VEDRTIVQALRDRDRSGLAAAYDQYARRLFDYCVGLLHDRDAAGDAVHDTLLVASDRAHQLRDPEKLRPWLYAIARNECLRQLRQRNRLAPLEKAGDVKDDTVDLGRSVSAEQARRLVYDAAAGLNPREREVLDLTLRHELTGGELAEALGVSANHAHALTSKARDQLERSVGALLTARAGRADCTELDSILTGWNGAFTPLVRKRVSRHLEQCAVCGIRRKHEVRAEALFATIPFAVLPVLLRDRILDSSADLQRVSHHSRIASPFDRSGFPVPLDQRSKRSKSAALLAGAAVLTLLLGSGVAMTLRPGSQEATLTTQPKPTVTEEPSEAATEPFSESPAPTSASPSPSASPSASPSVRRARPPIVDPAPTRVVVPPRVTPRPPAPTRVPPTTKPPAPPTTPPPTTRPPSPRPRPAPVIGTVTFDDIGGCDGAVASATLSGGPARSVTFHYWPSDAPARRTSIAMGQDGNTWYASVPNVLYNTYLSYQATAVGVDGQKVESAVFNAVFWCVT